MSACNTTQLRHPLPSPPQLLPATLGWKECGGRAVECGGRSGTPTRLAPRPRRRQHHTDSGRSGSTGPGGGGLISVLRRESAAASAASASTSSVGSLQNARLTAKNYDKCTDEVELEHKVARRQLLAGREPGQRGGLVGAGRAHIGVVVRVILWWKSTSRWIALENNLAQS